MPTITVGYAMRRTNSFASAGNAIHGHVTNVVFGALSAPKTGLSITFAVHAIRLAIIFARRQQQFGLVLTVGERV